MTAAAGAWVEAGTGGFAADDWAAGAGVGGKGVPELTLCGKDFKAGLMPLETSGGVFDAGAGDGDGVVDVPVACGAARVGGAVAVEAGLATGGDGVAAAPAAA